MKTRYTLLLSLLVVFTAACSRPSSNNSFAYLTLAIDEEVYGASVDITYNPNELTFLGTAALQPGVIASNSQNGMIKVALMNSETISGALLKVAFATNGPLIPEPLISQGIGVLSDDEIPVGVSTEWVTGLTSSPVTDVESQELSEPTLSPPPPNPFLPPQRPTFPFPRITDSGLQASFANFPLGDFTQTGSIDLSDAVAVLKVHVGSIPFDTLSPYRKYHSDIQCDGNVGLAEAVRVLRKHVGVVFPAQAQVCPRQVRIEGNQEALVLIGNLGTEQLPDIQPDAYEGLNISGSAVGGSGPLVNLVFKRKQEGASTFTVRDVKLSRNLQDVPAAGGQLAVPGNKPAVSQLALIPALSSCAEAGVREECTVRVDLENNVETDQWEGFSFIIENSSFELVRAEGTGIGSSCSPQIGARVGAACAANFSGGGSVADKPGKAYKITRSSNQGSSGNLRFLIGPNEALVPIVVTPDTKPEEETFCPDGNKKPVNGECPAVLPTPGPQGELNRYKLAQWGDPFSPRLTCVKWASGGFFGKKWQICVGHKYQFLQIELFLVVRGPTSLPIPDIKQIVQQCTITAVTASGVAFAGTPSPELAGRIAAALAVLKPAFGACLESKAGDFIQKNLFDLQIEKKSFWPN